MGDSRTGITLGPLQGRPTHDLQHRLEITWRKSENTEAAGKLKSAGGGMKPRCKSFDSKLEAESWARELARDDYLPAATAQNLRRLAKLKPQRPPYGVIAA